MASTIDGALAASVSAIASIAAIFIGRPRRNPDKESRELRDEIEDLDANLRKARQDREDMRCQRDDAYAKAVEAHTNEINALDAVARANAFVGRLQQYVKRLEQKIEELTGQPLNRRWSDDIENDI